MSWWKPAASTVADPSEQESRKAWGSVSYAAEIDFRTRRSIALSSPFS
jgi:hypothetical protein